MKSYVKIYGPPIVEAIKVLHNIAVNMPEVCVRDVYLEMMSQPLSDQEVYDYYAKYDIDIPTQRCGKIISKSNASIGEYNFYFEWFKNPKTVELNNLIEKIDLALTPLGCKYTITTKSR